jgi:hypothetical protein
LDVSNPILLIVIWTAPLAALINLTAWHIRCRRGRPPQQENALDVASRNTAAARLAFSPRWNCQPITL